MSVIVIAALSLGPTLSLGGASVIASTQPASAADAPFRAQRDDPVSLINEAARLSREQRYEEARHSLIAAMMSSNPVEVRLPDGRWIDSRQAAKIALSRLPAQLARR